MSSQPDLALPKKPFFGLLEYAILAGIVAILVIMGITYCGKKWDNSSDLPPKEEIYLPQSSPTK